MTKVPKKGQRNNFVPHRFDAEYKVNYSIFCVQSRETAKAILTLLTKSLQYSMAVHILNLRALERKKTTENNTNDFL